MSIPNRISQPVILMWQVLNCKKDEEALEHIRQQNKANKEALRQVIEERKRRELENRQRQKQKPYIIRDRGGYER